MTQYECPKYESCNANVCPLWKPLNEQKQIYGEPVCYFLREATKVNAKEVFRLVGKEELFNLMVDALHEFILQPDPNKSLLKALERTSKNPSKMKRGLGLKNLKVEVCHL